MDCFACARNDGVETRATPTAVIARRRAMTAVSGGEHLGFVVIARSDLSAVAQRAKAEATKQSTFGHSGMVRRTRPQMRNCASGNLEIPGSMLRIATE